MSAAHFAVNFFVALFALIDPIGCAPLFAAATAGAPPAGRRLTAAYIALFSFVFMAFFFVTGLALLRFFGISLAAFRLAGGVLLFLLGLDMARGNLASSLADATGEAAGGLSARDYALARFERLVVPFAMPLLVGPGAISTVVIYAGEAGKLGFAGEAAGVGVTFAIGVSILASFWFAGLITRLLGRIGMIIVIRVLGLILCALAVQFMIIGVSEATVGLLLPSAAAPYVK
jgi:multiple antibiotic resistance protein